MWWFSQSVFFILWLMKLGLLFLFLLAYFSCSDNDRETSYDYLRSPSDFRPVQMADSIPPTKFILSWENPSRKDGHLRNCIYLDTLNWESILSDKKNAKVVLCKEANQKDRDSILISLGITGSPEGIDTLEPYHSADPLQEDIPYYLFDSSGRLDTNDLEFHFALVSEYSDDGIGQPRFTNFPVFDNIRPEPLSIIDDFTDRALYLSW
ncbi:hypothetical protein ACFL5V_11630, partial [Fibrobacterota bacterium]